MLHVPNTGEILVTIGLNAFFIDRLSSKKYTLGHIPCHWLSGGLKLTLELAGLHELTQFELNLQILPATDDGGFLRGMGSDRSDSATRCARSFAYYERCARR